MSTACRARHATGAQGALRSGLGRLPNTQMFCTQPELVLDTQHAAECAGLTAHGSCRCADNPDDS
eukprot:15059110-Alexandrium_andersonii.AAC.1